MGFPKTIPTIPIPYKLRKKGLFETIDNIDRPDTTCVINTPNITATTTKSITTDIHDVTDTTDITDTTDTTDTTDITDTHNVSDKYDTDITDNLITLSLMWLTITTILYIYIKY